MLPPPPPKVIDRLLDGVSDVSHKETLLKKERQKEKARQKAKASASAAQAKALLLDSPRADGTLV